MGRKTLHLRTKAEIEAIKQKVFDMRSKGATFKEISIAVGIPDGTGRTWCHRYGVKPESPEKIISELRERIAELERQLSATSSINDIEVVSREDARAKGLKRYFTGEPCKRGAHC